MSQLQKRGRFVATKVHWASAKLLLTLGALIVVASDRVQAAFGQIVAVINGLLSQWAITCLTIWWTEVTALVATP